MVVIASSYTESSNSFSCKLWQLIERNEILEFVVYRHHLEELRFFLDIGPAEYREVGFRMRALSNSICRN